MKSLKFYISLMLIAFIGLSGCKDDALVEGDVSCVEEGIPTTVSINFSTTPQKKLSRAEQTPEAEYNVSTIYLFAFNARGEKTGGQAFAVNGTEATGAYGNESFTGTINGFNVLTGSRQRLYAIANYNNGDFDLSKEKLDAIDTEAELLELSIATRNQQLLLNHLSFVMEGEEENVTVSINNNRQGVITSSDGGDVDIELKRLNAKITFDVTADVDGVIEGTLKFVPKSYMVMKVPLNASVVNQNTNLSDAKYASMSEESDKEDKAPITLFDEVEDTHCSFTFYMLENYSAPPEKGETGSAGSGLWIDEEAREAKENDGIESLYALREKEYKQEIPETERDPNYPGKTEENTGYKYAPNTATYVVIKGDLSYQRTNNGTTEYVNVSAEYTIHLGETGKATDADNEERVNNYTVARNVHYTYTIKLTGINSYDVEVNDDRKEERPGVEGDVVIAGDQVRAIDSHYARTRIKFTRTALQNGLSWIVQTPFDEGMKVANSDQNSLKDYKWVLFAVNKEFGVEINDHYNRTMVKFPGYEAYDGGASTMGGVQNNANEDEGNSSSNCLQRGRWKDRISENNFYYNRESYLSNDACLRDVNQLINHLRKIAEDDTKWSNVAEEDENRESVVYVTAFIDEYVYIYNPETQEYKIPDANVDDPDRLILWKQVVNGRDRLMHICTEGAKYSPDGESSWSNSVLTIRQSPIYSIYNELDSDIKSAWGTESILETPALPIEPDGNYSLDHGWNMNLTMDNGRYNTLSIFGSRYNNGDYQSRNILWTTVLSRDADDIGIGDTPKEEELQPGYRDVWHACMTRNRDLDGDNIIDPEEIRWVMASIDELTDLWIGESALPETAHLYQGDGTYMEHVVSSSGSYTAPWIIWAEEGASRGQYNDGDVNYKDPITGYRDYKYRCIRYLGIPLDNIEEIPKDYVTVTKVSSVYGDSYRLNLSKLDYSARRSSSDGGYELPLHFERGNDGNNRPYRAFEVLVTPQGEGATARHWTEDNITGFKDMVNFSNSSKLCPSGYRVPNQRELMLMYTSLNNSQGYNVSWGSGESYWSSTQFSFNGKGLYSANDRPGFATDASNMILTSTTQSAWDNVSGKVRCVRDVTE